MNKTTNNFYTVATVLINAVAERLLHIEVNLVRRWEFLLYTYLHIIKCSWLVSFLDMGPTCERYTGSLCRTTGSIGMDYIFFNTSLGNQNDYEMALIKVTE